jgi:phage terminase small subunit
MAKKKEQEHPLTPKQEAFALAYVETGNAAEAYRRAYDVKAATQHSSIYVAASRLLDNPKVMLRVEELQKQAAELMKLPALGFGSAITLG